MKELKRTLNTLSLVYENYGGISAIIKSPFLHLSAIGAIISWSSLVDGSWPALTKSVLPNLAGFSIAAYAMIFAMLDAKSRELLNIPLSEFDNRSPLLMLISSISHAVIVQIAAIFFAALFDTRPFPYIESLRR